ncbi:MAG TPA: type II secretion system protein [Edaphobacter sp.]|nr:type II secretion system protein [Edaphobacter sp.]
MRNSERENEQGFMLVGLIVAIFIILLLLGVAAPKVARDLRREREVEAIHRGNQYVRAVQLYYRKFQHYPGSIEQLEKTNNVRFLRQRYADPMTGKADWRLIKVGEAKTTVKGFFGQPLAGIAPGLGTAAGMASPGIGGAPGSTGASNPTFGGPSTGGPGSGSSPIGGASGSSTPGAAVGTDASGVSGATGSTGGIGSQSATSFSGGGAPFVGVGSSKSGESITVLNEQPSYQTWEFIYDPRIEQLKAKASLFGGGPATSTLGSAAGSASPGQGGTTTPTTPGGTNPTNPTTPSSPFSTSPQ